MHTDYQAVARQLEWLADDLPDSETKLDLKILARNVRLLGVMTHVLVEARKRRRLANLVVGPAAAASAAMLEPAGVPSERPGL
jgi:hypothetical protein